MSTKIIWKNHSKKTGGPNYGKKQTPQRQKFCRICGGKIAYGDMCPSCRKFIKDKKRGEHHEHGRSEDAN